MKLFFSLFLLVVFQLAKAHESNLSSLMIYEQNGRHHLIIKSSINAFEGEVDYKFGKNAYKTPVEFQNLVIQLFQKNCFVKANGLPINLINPNVTLGHETTLFAELSNFPDTFSELNIQNTMFADMPANICEIILTLNGLPQKQYLLKNENKQRVTLQVKNNKLEVAGDQNILTNKSLWLVMGLLGMLAVLILIAFFIRNKRKTALVRNKELHSLTHKNQ